MLKSFPSIVVGLCLALSMCVNPAAAGPVDLTPPKPALGFADAKGQLLLIEELGEAGFSGGVRLPVRLDFSSGRVTSKAAEKSLYGWDGWFCGALESEARFNEDRSLLSVSLLCSKVLIMVRDPERATRFVSPNHEWEASLAGKTILVERWDGWQLRFVDRKIASLKTDGGNVLTWIRDREGRTLEIRETATNSAPLKVLWNEDRTQVQAIEAGRTYHFSYSDGGLSQIEWAQGVAGTARRVIRRERDSIAVGPGESLLRRYAYNAESGQLKDDGANRYTFEPLKAKGAGSDALAITLTDFEGGSVRREAYPIYGVTRLTSEDGTQRIVRRITRQGPHFGAIARIERVVDGERFILLRNHFGPTGRVTKREWLGEPSRMEGYQNGVLDPVLRPDPNLDYRSPIPAPKTESEWSALSMCEIDYQFDAASRHIGTTVNGEQALEKAYDNKGRQTVLAIEGRFRREMIYDKDGNSRRVLTIHGADENSGPPRETRYNALGQTTLIELADGRIDRRNYDKQGRIISREVVAPDGKTLLESSDFRYQSKERLRLERRVNHQQKFTSYFRAELLASGLAGSSGPAYEKDFNAIDEPAAADSETIVN